MKKLNYILIFVLLCVLDMKAAPSSGDNVVYLAKVEVGGSPAIIDLNGNYVVRPGKYESIYYDKFSEGLCPVKRNGRVGFIDVYGNEVIPCKWESAREFKRGLAVIGIESNGDYRTLRGMINKKGEVVIPPNYFHLELVRNADLIRTESPASLYNFHGDLLLKDIFHVYQSCRNGMLLISRNGQYGGYFFVDSLGNKRLKNFYDVDEFCGGYAVAYIRDEIKGNRPGYIDTEGNQYLVGEYKGLAGFYEDGYAKVSKEYPKKGVINNNFEEIIPCMYDDIKRLSWSEKNKLFINDIAEVIKDDQHGIINTRNQILIPFGKFNGFRISEGGELLANTSNRYERKDKDGKITSAGYKSVLINKTGDIFTDFEYEKIDNFYNGYAIVTRNGNNGIINSNGKEVIPAKYEFDYNIEDRVIKEFVDLGVIRIKKDGKWGLLNNQCMIILPCVYNYIEIFQEGVAVVRLNKKYGVVNQKGEIITPIDFYVQSSIPRFSHGRLGIKKRTDSGTKAGFIDKEGNEIIPCIYDKVYPFKEISVN